MKIIKIFFLLAFVSINICYSQTSNKQPTSGIVSGKIKEIYTNLPISYTTVKIKDTDLKAVSNDSGFYMIKNIKPGIYNFEISSPGCRTVNKDSVRIDEGQSLVLDFVLSDKWDCYKYIDTAYNDIKKNKVKILIAGLTVKKESSTPKYLVKRFEESMKKLSEKYGFEYKNVGCTFPCSGEYNKIITEYLEKRNGKDWEEKYDEEVKKLKESYYIK